MAMSTKRDTSGKIEKVHLSAFKIGQQLGLWIDLFRIIIVVAILIALIAASAYLSIKFQTKLEAVYATEQSIEKLRSFTLNIGSALIGATAIVFSFVLFAMQINMERLPYGLFRRLGVNRKLIWIFTLTFFLAIFICTISIFISKYNLNIILLLGLWSLIFILFLFIYSYHLSLFLISPVQQMNFLVRDSRKKFNKWNKILKRAGHVLEQKRNLDNPYPFSSPEYDNVRISFFQSNKLWNNDAKQAVRHAVSFAQHYARRGDYEVSNVALSSIVKINAAYIEVKGKTFYEKHPIFDHWIHSDEFINDTLEHLRQNTQRAIEKKDETQVNQIFHNISKLISAYLSIKYPDSGDEKVHTKLAALQLAQAVYSAVPHNMFDVLVEGQRSMREAIHLMVAAGDLENTENLNIMIANIARQGYPENSNLLVIVEGMNHFAKLTLDLIDICDKDIHLMTKEIQKHVFFIVKSILEDPKKLHLDFHKFAFGSYYSSTRAGNLKEYLIAKANAISKMPSDTMVAQSKTHNFEKWGSGLYCSEGALLFVAIQANSPFTHDLIHWIADITDILLAVAGAPACDSNTQEKLKQHALRLIATLDPIPDDEDTVRFIENFKLTEILLEAVLNARRRSFPDIAKAIGEQLLRWTLHKCGRHKATQDPFKRGLCASAAIALKGDDEAVHALKSDLQAWAREDKGPYPNVLDRTAEEIREYADELPDRDLQPSGIEQEISESDCEALSTLLEEIADIMSPATRGQRQSGAGKPPRSGG